MKNTISTKITKALSPSHLEVLDESYMHSAGADAQSHFKVTVVSNAFVDLLPLVRHRKINAILKAELDGQIHALALHTFTADEWFKKAGKSPTSPDCMGASK
jgi:BolA protein